MRAPATKRDFKNLSVLSRTTPEPFKKIDEIEKKVRQQLLPSNTGKNHINDEDRTITMPGSIGLPQ